MESVWPPPDPENDYYLTVCFVCEEVAKPGQTHMRNYGGTVCFSCRQFFRRAHQGAKIPSLACKNGDNCQITVSNRRKCQKCRYRLCRLAGMTPEAVLSEDQKKVRFQRMIRKREATRTGGIDPFIQIRHSSLISIPPQRIVAKRRSAAELEEFIFSSPRKLPKLEPIIRNLSGTSSPPAAAMTIHHNEMPETPPPEPEVIVNSWPDFLTPKVDQVYQAFDKAISLVTTFNQEAKDLSLEKIHEKSVIFKHFSQFVRPFLQIDERDQAKLLAKNTPLYIQMCISRFITIASFEELKNLSKMFRPQTDIQKYFRMAIRLKDYRLNDPVARSVLAYVILFHFEDEMRLIDQPILEEFRILNSLLLQNCKLENSGKSSYCKDSLTDFGEILKSMASFCSHNLLWTNVQTWDSISPQIVFHYSKDQEHWLRNQLELAQEAKWSVALGEDLLREFLMFSIGVPPSQFLLTKFCKVFKERVWRILEIHPEFISLPESTKCSVASKRETTAILLLLARQEVISSGLKQCQELFGEYHELEIQKSCQQVLNRPTNMKKFWLQKSCMNLLNSEIRKLHLEDILLTKSNAESQLFIQKFSKVTSRYQKLLVEPLLFRVMFLFLLVKSDDVTSCQPLSELEAFYLRSFWSRMNWISSDETKSLKTLSKIFKFFSKLEKMVCDFEGICRI